MAIKEELLALAVELENASMDLNNGWLQDKADEVREMAERQD